MSEPEEGLESPDAATTASGPARSPLARRAASGVKWGLVATASQQIVRVLFTMVLARIIGPHSFGVVSQATIYVTLTQLFLDQGFGSALIQKREIDRVDVASVFWLNVLGGLAVSAVTLLVAPGVADFFHTPELTSVLRVLTILVMLNAMTVAPWALVNRRMGFRLLAVSQSVSVLVGGAAGLAAAAAGADYWAVVVQNLTIGAVNLVWLFAAVGLPSVRASATRIREMFAFTSGLVGTRFARFTGENVDNVLVGRYVGTEELAFYALSYRLLQLPIRLVGQIVNQVSLATFSRIQDQPARMRRWFLTSTTAMATSTYGFLTLAILASPDAIPMVFGDRWEPAVRPMQILVAVAYRSLVVMLVAPLFTSTGRTRLLFKWTLLSVTVTIVGIVVGLQWGIVGVASGVAIAMYAIAPLNLAAAARLISLRAGEYTRAILPAWVASAAVVAIWFPARAALTAAGVTGLASLVVASVLGLAVYVAVMRLAFARTFDAMREVLALVFRRGAPVAPAPSTT
jgi:PST family polysaccharide transporter